MKNLKLDGEATARVWLGDLPAATYQASSVLARKVNVIEGVEDRCRVAAVELFRPLGARFAYGMLGGHLWGDKSRELLLEVNSSETSAGDFDGNVSRALDSVHTGLPPEFVPSVMAGLQRGAAQVRTLSAGRLKVDCAAYGEIGSSPAIFEVLGAALIKLLSHGDEQPSESELIELFILGECASFGNGIE